MQAGARLEWLPLEAICYSGCLAENRLTMDVQPGGELLAWDVTAFGLPHAQQPFVQGHLCQHLEVPGVWLERGTVDAKDTRLLDSPLGLAGLRCMASLMLVCGEAMGRPRKEQALDVARAVIAAHPLAATAGVTSPAPQVVGGPGAGPGGRAGSGLAAQPAHRLALRAMGHSAVQPAYLVHVALTLPDGDNPTMALPEDDYSNCAALVVDSNPTSRSILVSQLRDFGVGSVAQASRTTDVRQLLEYRIFDFVLCEQYFTDESASGQDLLDDLRRNQLLPFSTVFIMITGEATYSKVAEAAESALDGYLLKPHKASQLAERLHAARVRKVSLHDIFAAIEAEHFERAADLCLERFESKGLFWLYAARVGAELLLRLDRYDEAQKLYQAVIAAKTLPWARLGVARAQLESGQVAQAASLLETLINEDSNYADAYDIMGRAQFELGKFDMALETYKMAAKLTPSSISRVQKLAMMTFFGGDHAEAEKLLDRTARMGLDSKMFDCQTLVLLAFARLESSDRKGLYRCQEDFNRLMERNPDNPRLRRQADIVIALNLIMQQQFGLRWTPCAA